MSAIHDQPMPGASAAGEPPWYGPIRAPYEPQEPPPGRGRGRVLAAVFAVVVIAIAVALGSCPAPHVPVLAAAPPRPVKVEVSEARSVLKRPAARVVAAVREMSWQL